MKPDEEKFRTVVIEALRIKPSQYLYDLKIGDLEEWDSVAHLDLVSSLESAFGVCFSADEMLELTSLEKLRARLAS